MTPPGEIINARKTLFNSTLSRVHPHAAHVPDEHRNAKPGCRRADQHRGSRLLRQEPPNNRGKHHHSDASHGGAGCIYTGDFSSADRAVQSSSFLFSCCSFSSNVALAGKIAGKAINRPPSAGPYLFAMMPARTQMAPPNRNLRANWYHFAWRSADKLTLIFKDIYLSSKNQRPRETANHTGIRLTVTERLDHWPLISSQVAQEA